MGEQFSERDKAFIKQSIDEVNVPYGETVIIKQFTGVSNAGDPARGIEAQYGYKLTPIKAIVETVTANDVMYSGGIYQLGDIKLSLRQQLNAIDTISQTGGPSQGDRLSYRGHDYRIVGKITTGTLDGNDRVFSYVFRKIGNT